MVSPLTRNKLLICFQVPGLTVPTDWIFRDPIQFF